MATDASRAAQAAHLARLKAMDRYPGCTFTSPDNLAKHILSTAIVDLLAKAQRENPQRQPRNLPFASLGSLFKGRDSFLDKLRGVCPGFRASLPGAFTESNSVRLCGRDVDGKWSDVATRR